MSLTARGLRSGYGQLCRREAEDLSGRVRLPENVQVDQVGGSRGWAPGLAESVARNVAGHQTGGVGVPIREADDASLKGQLLAAEFPAEIKDGRSRLGQLPGDEENSFLAVE